MVMGRYQQGRYQQMALTDTKIRALKPTAKQVKLTDGQGLYLLHRPNGSKLWQLAYRYASKQRVLSIGQYPAVDLADARKKAKAARKLLADGVDPNAQKRLDRLAVEHSAAMTFNVVADELLAKKAAEGRAAATLDKTRWLLDFARPKLGTRPIAEISAAEVLAVLREVEKRGRLESARRLRSVVGEVFRYGVATARAASDPTISLKGALTAPTVTHRAAILDPVALGGLLRAIDGFDGQPTTRAALQLMSLLFPRPGELRLALWPEFDLDAATWTIPAARTKMRRPHRVPLPRQAIAILTELHALTGRGKLVFPGYGVGGHAGKPIEQRPISENTLNGALRRLGYGSDQMTSHGFRATASTLLNESGRWRPDVIEAALAHQDEDDVRRAYARGEHWASRVEMARWWADHLDTLREGGKVIALARPA